MPKKFPYKKIFDTKLQRIIESGSLDSIRRHWEHDIPDCKIVEEDNDSLALGPGVSWNSDRNVNEINTVLYLAEKLISMFILPGSGYIVSLIIFTSEMIRGYISFHKYVVTEPANE